MRSIVDIYIAAARPDATQNANVAFTDRVMAAVVSSEIFSRAIRKTSVTKKETLFMKIRHLPKMAIIAIAIGALLFVAGTTYAIVQTVSKPSPVKVNQAGTNEFGREELKVEFNSCDSQKEEGTTYELKRGSDLSAEDGAKVLQAKCDLDIATNWLQNDPKTKEKLGNWHIGLMPGLNSADTVKEIQGNTLVLEKRGERTLLDDARFVEDGSVVSRDDIKLKPGDSVVYYVPDIPTSGREMAQDARQANGAVVFKLPLEARYYSLEYMSYVHARSACRGNPERLCLQSNHINQTYLIVARGGTAPVMNDSRVARDLQGKVVSYDASAIKLDVGGGILYTFQTPRNIIDEYNRTTVYGLASFDTIYAKTNPEDLKIKPGDSLEINYLEANGETSTTLSWNQVGTIGLMVERTVKDLMVLQKY